MADRGKPKKPNCHWVAFVLIDELYEVSFVVSQKQMNNWQARPRSPKTTRNYCYLANAKLEKEHGIKRKSLDFDEIRVLRFEPRDPDGHEAINVPVPTTELVRPKPESPKLPKNACEGQGSLFDEAV